MPPSAYTLHSIHIYKLFRSLRQRKKGNTLVIQNHTHNLKSNVKRQTFIWFNHYLKETFNEIRAMQIRFELMLTIDHNAAVHYSHDALLHNGCR